MGSFIAPDQPFFGFSALWQRHGKKGLAAGKIYLFGRNQLALPSLPSRQDSAQRHDPLGYPGMSSRAESSAGTRCFRSRERASACAMPAGSRQGLLREKSSPARPQQSFPGPAKQLSGLCFHDTFQLQIPRVTHLCRLRFSLLHDKGKPAAAPAQKTVGKRRRRSQVPFSSSLQAASMQPSRIEKSFLQEAKQDQACSSSPSSA